MTRKIIIYVIAFELVISICAIYAQGILVIYDSKDPIEATSLPKQIIAAVNKQKRVYCYTVAGRGTPEGQETYIYFKGNANNLNSFLMELSGVEKAFMSIKFILDKSVDVKPMSFLPDNGVYQEKDLIHYDWKLVVDENVNYIAASQPDETTVPWYVTVIVPLSGNISLEELKLPVVYELKVGGQLGRLVEGHNKRKKSLNMTTNSTLNVKPTTLEMLDASSRFGDVSLPDVKKDDLPTKSQPAIK